MKTVIHRIRLFQQRFGFVTGILFWFRFRQHVRKQHGELHIVQVPGLRHPLTLRAGTSDIEVFQQIFLEGELAFDLRALPTRIVDAGANIGLASVYLASRFPQAKIVALEIDTDNLSLLKHNTAHYPGITCLGKALWSGTANLRIANPTAAPMSFRVGLSTQGDSEGLSSVGVKDLADMFDGHRIDLLKIDIEGSEKEVFENGMHTWVNQVDTIAVELHDRFQPGCSKALADSLLGRKHTRYQVGEYTVIELAGAVS